MDDERPQSRARPESRAQSSIQQQRPMTSGRPMSSAARPSTASRRAPPTALGRPGTASRLAQQMQAGINVQSARPGTRGGVVPATALGRVDRPLSQYGLPTTAAGAARGSTAAASSGRIVQDRTYWANIVKTRLLALRGENENVQRDVQQMHTDAGTLPLYQQDAERTAQELTNLRGELNDYSRLLENTPSADDIDKMRRNTDTLRTNNARTQRQLDELYSERKSRQNEVTQWRMRLEELNNKEASLNSRMDGEQRNMYEKFKQANRDILQDLSTRQAELDKLKQRRQAIMAQIHEQHNDDRIQAVGVLEQLFDLSDKIKQEEDEIADTETIEQKQNKLQAMVKLHTEEIETLQKQIKSYERQMEQTRETLQELESNDTNNVDNKKQDRFRQLNEKVHEMEDFLQEFDDRKQDFQAETVKRTEQIGELTKQLERLKKDVAAYDADIGEADILNAKTIGTAASAAAGDSVEALKAQIDDCRARLLKISKVDNKLGASKQGFENDITTMKAEQTKFRNPEQHATVLQQKIADIGQQIQTVTRATQQIESSLRDDENSVKRLKQDNESHAHHSELIRLEHKLQQLESQRTTMEAELSVKRSDMNFDFVRDQVMHQVHTLNKALQHYYATRKL